LTGIQTSDNAAVMNTINPKASIRFFAAILVTVTVIGLSTLATHPPAQTQNPVTLKNIQTDRTATFYADRGPSCAWFVDLVLPTGDSKLADRGPSCAWFVDLVLPTGDSNAATENLKSVAATL
jgi:hypothetical protein